MRLLSSRPLGHAWRIYETCLAFLKKLRKGIVNNPGWSQAEIRFIRKAEFEYCISSDLFCDKDVLEIGGSDGYLASLIEACFPLSLLSIDCSPVTPSYCNVEMSHAFVDGHALLFADNSFDVIFSSNTFEHINDLDLLFLECARVLRSSGVVVLMLPSPTWRIASILSQVINLLLPLPHGEHSWSAFDEIIRFHPSWWKDKFNQYGFKCNGVFSCGYFYAEPRIFPLSQATIHIRRALAKLYGPSSYIYFLSLEKA